MEEYITANQHYKREVYNNFYEEIDIENKIFSKWFTVDEMNEVASPFNDTADKKKSISTTLGQLAVEHILKQDKSSSVTKYCIIVEQDESNANKINNFQDFKDFLEKFRKANIGKRFYFRGESECFPTRLPSIYREEEGYEGTLASRSDRFYSDLAVELGEIQLMSELKTTQLARFQHYQAPTRLLDVSTNPLIALFFAVEQENDKDKKLFFYAVDNENIKYQSGHTAQLKAALNWMNQHEINEFIRYVEVNKDNAYAIKNSQICNNFLDSLNQMTVYGEFSRPVDIFNSINESQFVSFIKQSPRMQQQQGAFIMPKHLTGLEANIKENGFKELNQSVNDSAKVSEFLINASKSKEIKDYLSTIGINSGTTYPDIEHYASYLASAYRQ